MKLLLFIIASAFALNTHSQNQTIQWQNLIAGEAMEFPGKMIQSTNGSYFSVGATTSTIGDLAPYKGYYDAWIVKIDANGNFAWKKNFGGSNVDILTDIIQTNDGNYIASGHSGSSDGDLSTNTYSANPKGALLIKFDDNGNILWQKRVGGGGELHARIIESPNGELNVFASSTADTLDVLSHYGTSSTHDIVYFKLTSTGTVIQQKTYGGSENEYLSGVSATNDGGFVVLTSSYSSDYDISQHAGTTNDMDAWVFKIDINKNLVWEKSYMINGMGQPNNVLELSNGSIIFSYHNNQYVNNMYTDGIVTLLNAQGNVIWQKPIGGAKFDDINDFIEIAPNHIVLLGSTDSNDSIVVNNIPGNPVWLLEIDSLGTINWQNTYGGTGGETAANFVKTSDGGFAISANTRSHDLDVINPYYWSCMCTEAWLFKVGPMSVGINETNKNDAFSLYPNPAHDLIHVNSRGNENESYVLVNALGQTVLSGKLEGQDKTIDIQTLTPGFYSLQVGKQTQSYKIIKN